MAAALLVARLFLALVFLVAGLSKLADRPGSRQAMGEFGVPEPLALPIGLALPLVELAIAVALIPTQSAWGASIAALGILLAFVAGIGVNLARGRRPDCHCFGQVYSKPIGIETLLRNGILAAVAGFVVWQGQAGAGASATDWLASLSPAEGVALGLAIVGLALIVSQWWFLFNMMRMNGRLLMRIEALEGDTSSAAVGGAPEHARHYHGLPVGSEAPEFALPGLDGDTVTLQMLRARGKPVLLLFTSPSCGPCSGLMPEIGQWQAERRDLTVALISEGQPEENRAKCAEHGISTVLLQAASEVAEDYKSPGTPGAVIVATDGTLASPVAVGADGIRELVAGTFDHPAAPTNAQFVPLLDHMPPRPVPSYVASGPIGKLAPPIRLPDVHGTMIDLSDFRGSKTVVLFWNTGCGFCQRMLPDLAEWEVTRPSGAPRLLVVSAGSEEEVRAMKLRSPVVMNPDFSVAQQYGAGGTPTGVLVDEEGYVASPVVAGAEAVLTLAKAETAIPAHP